MVVPDWEDYGPIITERVPFITCEITDVVGECNREAEYYVQLDMSSGNKECRMHAFEHIGSYMADGYARIYSEKLIDGMTVDERNAG